VIRELARGWLAIGTQSIGGGTSTLLMIERLVVERHRWLSAREYGEAWALSQLSPGIHIVALAGLLGRHVAGWRGVIVAVGAMMIPASAITVALTAGYGLIAESPIVRAALAGVAPVTGGMTIAVAVILVRSTARHGRSRFVDVAAAVASLGVALAFGSPTLALIAAGAVVGAVALGHEPPTSREAAMG
jgi:chromate transporter